MYTSQDNSFTNTKIFAALIQDFIERAKSKPNEIGINEFIKRDILRGDEIFEKSSNTYLEDFTDELVCLISKNTNTKPIEIRITEILNPLLEEYFEWYEQNYQNKELDSTDATHIVCARIFDTLHKTKVVISKYFPSQINTTQNQAITNLNVSPSNIKPIFDKEYIHTIFSLLKIFFSEEDQTQLIYLLTTGENIIAPLSFLDNGNRLADAFKQLKKGDIITGCQQKELEVWISKNFRYLSRNNLKEFTPRYLNDIISTNKDLCQRPILNVTIEKTSGKVLINKV